MLEDFILMGNLPVAIRSDEEMTKINKEEADKAFKFHKKILDEYLKKKVSLNTKRIHISEKMGTVF